MWYCSYLTRPFLWAVNCKELEASQLRHLVLVFQIFVLHTVYQLKWTYKTHRMHVNQWNEHGNEWVDFTWNKWQMNLKHKWQYYTRIKVDLNDTFVLWWILMTPFFVVDFFSLILMSPITCCIYYFLIDIKIRLREQIIHSFIHREKVVLY